MTLFLSKAEQQASNFCKHPLQKLSEELTIQISAAYLAVAIIPESYCMSIWPFLTPLLNVSSHKMTTKVVLSKTPIRRSLQYGAMP